MWRWRRERRSADASVLPDLPWAAVTLSGCTGPRRYLDMRLVAFARFAVLSLVLTAVACRGTTNPINPSPGVAGGGGQPPPASVTVSRLQIGGPDSVPPGEAVQLSATAFLSDGTTRIVTNEVSWESFHGHMMSISPTGVVTAGPQPGEGLIIARYSGLPLERQGAGWASREQLVLPAGTYRLYGSVKDEGVTLNGVRVELTAGPAAGMSLTANGYFRFYGVSGETEIRVSKDGYETQVRRSQVTSNRTEEFALALSSPRPMVDGLYALTIAAAAECRAALPEAARERTVPRRGDADWRGSASQIGRSLGAERSSLRAGRCLHRLSRTGSSHSQRWI